MQRMAARWGDANQSHQQTGRNHVTKSQGKALMREQDEAAPQQGRPPAAQTDGAWHCVRGSSQQNKPKH